MDRNDEILREAADLAYWRMVADVLEATLTDEWEARRWAKVKMKDDSVLNITPVLAERLLVLGDRGGGMPAPSRLKLNP